MCLLSRVLLFASQWAAAHQVPLTMEFSRQEYWSGLPFPPPENLPDPEIEPLLLCLLHWQVDLLRKLVHPEGVPVCSDNKESTCNAGDLGSIPGLGSSPGEGNGNLLQYSCLASLMDKGAWQGLTHSP